MQDTVAAAAAADVVALVDRQHHQSLSHPQTNWGYIEIIEKKMEPIGIT